MSSISSRVQLFEQIRRDRRVDPQVSARTLAKRYRVSRRTVGAALAMAVPPPRSPRSAQPSVLDPAKPLIDDMLRADLSAPRKQRHTIRRIFDRLVDEHGMDYASYTTVREYVNVRRRQIIAEAAPGSVFVQGMVPQVHEPGAEAQVDFAEVTVMLAGTATVCHLFTLRLSYSGKAVHRVYASQSQEAFMEGHVEAFRVLGGVPWRHIRYDNLSAAVKQVCFGQRRRLETLRWTAFRSHYGFDAFYCLPGIDGAHEKGGVEHDGGRFRRNHLVPVPVVASLAELNERLADADAAEDHRHIDGGALAVGEAFAAEEPLLRPLPDDDFECGVILTPTVSRTSRITVRQTHYSVPARFIGRKVRVALRGSELVVFDGRRIVACHPRLTERGAYRDDLDHYLEILQIKPGALAGSSALAQARADGVFTGAHQRFWDAARATLGEAAGTRALIDVLLLHRHRPPEAVHAGLATVLALGSVSAELVAVEARKAAGTLRPDVPVDLSDLDLPDIHTSHQPTWHADTRPAPSMTAYDQLLTRRPKDTP